MPRDLLPLLLEALGILACLVVLGLWLVELPCTPDYDWARSGTEQACSVTASRSAMSSASAGKGG